MSRRSIVIGPLCLLLFTFVALLVNLRWFANVDLAVLLAVRPLVIPGLDPIVRAVTQLGEPEASTFIAVALSLLALRARRGDFWVPMAVVVTLIVEYSLKTRVYQPEPSEYGASLGGVNSFPSGHVARETFLLLVVSGPLRTAAVVGGIAFAALSRIYWGDHWTSDVIGGLLLGAGVAWTARAVAGHFSAAHIPSPGQISKL